MKILAIRGRNLNSLADEFEVNLHQAPLDGRSAFAISGPTGAGKSTILDAMCLALYDTTPRLEKTNRLKVPDASAGNSVQADDPRQVLRRGASSAFAECDFLANDGIVYRARWSVWRANEKPQGALQDAKMEVFERDSGRVCTGSTKREVLKFIREKVGLDFQQFSRAVLLAQNDFAALLHADVDERALLLERLTGTEIYTKYSKDVYARAKKESVELARLELEGERSKVLSDEERSLLETQIRESVQTLSHLQLEEQRLNKLSEQNAVLQSQLRAVRDEIQTSQEGLREVRSERDSLKQASEAAQRFFLSNAIEGAWVEDWMSKQKILQQAASLAREGQDLLARLDKEAIEAATAKELCKKAQARAHQANASWLLLSKMAEEKRALSAKHDLSELALLEQHARHAVEERRKQLDLLVLQRTERAGAQKDSEQLKAMVARIESLREEVRALQDEREALAKELEHAMSELRGAEQMQGAVIEALRDALQPGDPCAVCGSTEHPYRNDETLRKRAEDALGQKLESLRARTAFLDSRLAELDQRMRAKEIEAERSEEKCTFAQNELEKKQDLLLAREHSLLQMDRVQKALVEQGDGEVVALQGSSLEGILLLFEQELREATDEARLREQASSVARSESLEAEQATHREREARKVWDAEQKKFEELRQTDEMQARHIEESRARAVALQGESQRLFEAVLPAEEQGFKEERLLEWTANADRFLSKRSQAALRWAAEREGQQERQRRSAELDGRALSLQQTASVAELRLARLRSEHETLEKIAPQLQADFENNRAALQSRVEQQTILREALKADDELRVRSKDHQQRLDVQRVVVGRWQLLSELIGSASGNELRKLAQEVTLDLLLAHANHHLQHLANRYRLEREPRGLQFFVIDDDFWGQKRGVSSLSGGETFLVSLALALGLASISAEKVQVQTLFVDEGFGSLDARTIQVALSALERLHQQGRQVGVISHVGDLAERLGAEIRVEPKGGGRSVVHAVAKLASS